MLEPQFPRFQLFLDLQPQLSQYLSRQSQPIRSEKRDKKRGKGVVEKGEVQEETPLEPTKVVKVTRAQQGKGMESLSIASKRRSKVPI